MLRWISANPSVAASVLAAVISASVALIVFAITQFITQKRERTQLLLPKLEELYILLNEVRDANVKTFKMAYQAIGGNARAIEVLRCENELELYGHGTAKRIIMYIQLYFPRLSRIHQLLFAAQREVNDILFKIMAGQSPSPDELSNASGRVAHMIRLMDAEIIDNRDILVNSSVLPRKYKRASDQVLSAIPEPPPGPVMSTEQMAK